MSSLTNEGGRPSRGSGDTLFLEVKSGNMVFKTDEDNPKAKKRTYTNPQTGEEGESWEVIHSDLKGRITGMDIKDNQFGEQFQVTVENGSAKAVLTLKTDSRYFSDFAKKAPNLDLAKDVTINVFDFVPKGKDKPIVGFSLLQDGEKVTNAYWDGKKNAKGYPVMEEKNPDSDDWKLHFLQERKYLKKKLALIEVPEYTTPTDTASQDQGSSKEEEVDNPFGND